MPPEYTYYAYTERGQIERQWGNGTFPIAYDYDDYGRLKEQRQYRDDSDAQGTDHTKYSKVTWTRDNTKNNYTGLVTSKKHWDSDTTGKSVSFQYNDLGLTSKRTWSRGDSTVYSYSIGGSTKTGQLTLEDHNDITDVSYTYDRMGRISTVNDHTGPRTLYYNKLDGLALGWEDLDDSFYGTGNLDHYYESAGTGKVEGRYMGFTYGSGIWSHTYETASGRLDAFSASGSGYSQTFDYTYDSDSNHVDSMDGGSYDQERYYESTRENYVGTNTTWNGTDRAFYGFPNLTWQHQYIDYKLEHNGSASLAAKLNSSGDIKHSMTYDPDHQLKTWDSDRTGGTDSSYTWDSAGNPSNYDGQSYDIDGLNK